MDGTHDGVYKPEYLRLRRLELSLELLDSIVRSQKALARIAEAEAMRAQSAYEAAGEGAAPNAGRGSEELMRALTQYQMALAEKIALLEPGLRIPSVRRGKPGVPWIHPNIASSSRHI